MKQIFDWLRGAILDKAYKVYDGTVGVDIHDVGELINEAEAKWESDCCEWEQPKPLEFCPLNCVTSCGHAEHYSVGIDKYCRHCGKPIKILEVERCKD